MALQTKTGTIECPASTGTQAITGLGFQPEAIFFFYTTLTADGSEAHHQQGAGFCDDTLRQMSYCSTARDARGTTTSAESRIQTLQSATDNKAAITLINISGAIRCEAEVISLDGDGFTLDWDNVINGTDIHYVAIAGGTDYYVGEYQLPSSTGTLSITGTGFVPDTVLQIQTGSASVSGSSSWSALGFSAFNLTEEYSTSGYSNSSQTTTNDRVRQESQAVAHYFEQDLEEWTANLDSMDADGFTLDFTVANASLAPRILYLAIKGVNSKIGVDTQKTSTGTKNTTGVGFQPDVLLLWSANAPSAVGSIANNRISLGAGVSSSDRRCTWHGGKDAVVLGTDVSDESQNSDTTAILRMMTEGSSSPTLDAEADLTSLDADGFTLDWTTADGTAREFVYLALTDLSSVSKTFVGMMECEGDRGTTYYVDYDVGDDANDGLSTSTPWQHAPGDDAVGTDVALLVPGDTVVFKSGVVYQGSATILSVVRVVGISTISGADGNAGNKITLISGDRHASAWGTGKAIIDGETTKKTGIYVAAVDDIIVDGFEVRNIGAPTADAAGVEFDSIAFTAHRGIARNCEIHDVNWDLSTDGTYVRSYGIENNLADFNVYEDNVIYNCTDKLIELAGGGNDPNTGSNDCIIRRNACNTVSVHGFVISGDRARCYDNIVWESVNRVIPNSPSSGYIIKVDEASDCKFWNNICYTGHGGIGVLVGRNNEVHHNVIYDIGDRGDGSVRERVGLQLIDDGSASDWSSPRVTGNKFYNNIVLRINGTSGGRCLGHTQFGITTDVPVPGDSNEFKNNLFYGAEGDTASTASRFLVSEGETTSGGPPTTEYNLTDWEAEFSANQNGLATGNIVGDPLLSGQQTDPMDVSVLPTTIDVVTDGFALNSNAFEPLQGSPAIDAGIVLPSPFDVDILGKTRTGFTLGAYEVNLISATTSLSTTVSSSVSTSITSTESSSLSSTGSTSLTSTASSSISSSLSSTASSSLSSTGSSSLTTASSPVGAFLLQLEDIS